MFPHPFPTEQQVRARGRWLLARARPGQIAFLANGRRQGPITRLISPWDIGELTHPFLLLNYAEVTQRSRPLFPSYAPSGAMTLTIVLEGELSYEDKGGRQGEVGAGGLAWMKAGGLVWHQSGPAVREPLRVFHLWIARRAMQDGSSAVSEYFAPDSVEAEGPVRVLLGQFGRARSRVQHAPADLNCLHVRLDDGERFRYAAPEGHELALLAIDRGGLQLLGGGERILWEQIALFGPGSNVIEVCADGETSFLLASAKRLA